MAHICNQAFKLRDASVHLFDRHTHANATEPALLDVRSRRLSATRGRRRVAPKPSVPTFPYLLQSFTHLYRPAPLDIQTMKAMPTCPRRGSRRRGSDGFDVKDFKEKIEENCPVHKCSSGPACAEVRLRSHHRQFCGGSLATWLQMGLLAVLLMVYFIIFRSNESSPFLSTGFRP